MWAVSQTLLHIQIKGSHSKANKNYMEFNDEDEREISISVKTSL